MAASVGPSSSDFVKKLFKMLEEQQYDRIVRWNDVGDSFIVLDHSNFASFVRQLNKYDFHKVRNTEENGGSTHGEGAWEFKHPDFQMHNKEMLDNIKRKGPTAKRGGVKKEDDSDAGPSVPSANFQNMQHQIDSLSSMFHSTNQQLQHLQSITKHYQTALNDMLNFQQHMAAQDQLVQALIGYLKKEELDDQAQKIINVYSSISRQGYEKFNDLQQHAKGGVGYDQNYNTHSHQTYENPSGSLHIQTQPTKSQHSFHTFEKAQQQSPQIGYAPHAASVASPQESRYSDGSNQHQDMNNPYHMQQNQQSQQNHSASKLVLPGPQDKTNRGQMQSHMNMNGQQIQDGIPMPLPPPINQDTNPQAAVGQAVNALRQVREVTQNFVPWAVPPKVLLVEDDAVCRRLSSKFLQVFGCEIDTAIDGLDAVNKMNLTKYDLVLMDIVMPHLDGVSATSIIRQFDNVTPIISMTSNVQSGDVMTYFNNGMNDILPKPFSKDGLLGMLEKHLIHLKALRQMEIPRALGVEDAETPQQNINSVPESTPSMQGQENFNFTEADYLGMLQGLMGGNNQNHDSQNQSQSQSQSQNQPQSQSQSINQAQSRLQNHHQGKTHSHRRSADDMDNYDVQDHNTGKKARLEELN